MSLVVGNFKMVSQLSGTLRISYPSSHFRNVDKNRLNYRQESDGQGKIAANNLLEGITYCSFCCCCLKK